MLDDRVFSIVRESVDDCLWAVVNTSGESLAVACDAARIGLPGSVPLLDLISGRRIAARNGVVNLELGPYQAAWIVA